MYDNMSMIYYHSYLFKCHFVDAAATEPSMPEALHNIVRKTALFSKGTFGEVSPNVEVETATLVL